MKRLWHNLNQNKSRYTDDDAERIVARGFVDENVHDGFLWFSDRPLLSRGLFTGVIVEIPSETWNFLNIEKHRRRDDPIEEFGCRVYEIPLSLVNHFPLRVAVPREGEGVET